jgi:hypothetical protein
VSQYKVDKMYNEGTVNICQNNPKIQAVYRSISRVKMAKNKRFGDLFCVRHQDQEYRCVSTQV